jgi:hypothetical protein
MGAVPLGDTVVVRNGFTTEVRNFFDDLAPASANWIAMARPMPRPAPVTTIA